MDRIQNSKTPSPDELRNDISSFLRDKYGDSVVIPPEAEIQFSQGLLHPRFREEKLAPE